MVGCFFFFLSSSSSSSFFCRKRKPFASLNRDQNLATMTTAGVKPHNSLKLGLWIWLAASSLFLASFILCFALDFYFFSPFFPLCRTCTMKQYPERFLCCWESSFRVFNWQPFRSVVQVGCVLLHDPGSGAWAGLEKLSPAASPLNWVQAQRFFLLPNVFLSVNSMFHFPWL